MPRKVRCRYTSRRFFGVGDVPTGGQRERIDGITAKACHTVDGAVFNDRCGNRITSLATALPEQLAVGQVVAPCSILRVGDYLSGTLVFHNQRGGPGGPFVSRLSPDFLATEGIQADDKGLAFVIPGYHQRFFVQRG